MSQQTGLWLYLAYLAFMAVTPLVFRVFQRRPIAVFGWLIFGGIAYEIAFWDSMNGLGCFSSVVGLFAALIVAGFWLSELRSKQEIEAAKQRGRLEVRKEEPPATAAAAKPANEAELPPIPSFPVWNPNSGATTRPASASTLASPDFSKIPASEWSRHVGFPGATDPPDPDLFKQR